MRARSSLACDGETCEKRLTLKKIEGKKRNESENMEVMGGRIQESERQTEGEKDIEKSRGGEREREGCWHRPTQGQMFCG